MCLQSPFFLIVEDHPAMAENHEIWLRKINENGRIIAVDHPDKAAIHLNENSRPDLVVVDILYGKMSGAQSAEPGVSFLRNILENHKTLNIFVYSSEYQFLSPLIPLVYKHQGGFTVASKLSRREIFLERAKSSLSKNVVLPPELRQHSIVLTQMEEHVVLLLCQKNMTDQAIAKQLKISSRTAQNIIQQLKEKFEIESQTDRNSRLMLCQKACRLGFSYGDERL